MKTFRSRPTKTPTARRAVRVMVWVLFVAALAGGVGLTRSQGFAAPVAASSVSTSVPQAASTVSVLAGGPDVSGTASQQVGALGDFYKMKDTNGNVVGTNKNGYKDPIELLPAWRWQSVSWFYTDVAWDDIVNRICALLASLMFALSSFVWEVLLGVLKFGLTTDLAHSAAATINTGFNGLLGSLNGAGVVFILIAVVLLLAVKFALKGNAPKILSMIITFVLPLAALQAMASAAAGVDSHSTGAAASPKGSPSWVAEQGTNIIDSVASGLGSGFGLLHGSVGDPSGETVNGAPLNPSCASYYDALYFEYYAYTHSGAGANGDVRSMGGKSGSTDSLGSVSYLWERAYLDNWTMAQYGDTLSARRIACHGLENKQGTSQKEILALQNAAGWQNMEGPGTDANGKPNGSASVAQFQSNDYSNHLDAWMMYWGACYFDNGWKARPGWNMSMEDGDLTGADKAGTPSGGHCKDWWSTGDAKSMLMWSDDKSIMKDANKVSAGVGGVPGNPAAADDLQTTALTYRGNIGPTRILYGVLGLLTSGIYAYALGAMAIGSVIAQFGFILLLIFLPATLVMLAAPGKKGEGRNDMGRKLLRMTAGFAAAKASLMVVLVLLIQTIATFESVASGATNAMGSTLGSIIHGILPLAALFLLRSILKAMGVGDITKLSGSLGMSSAAAAAAAGGNMKNKIAGAFDKAGNKEFGKNGWSLNKSPGMTGRWAGRKLKKGYNALDDRYDWKVGERLNLDGKKTALLGKRDKDGNLIEAGLAQQLRSLSGIRAMMGETALGKKALGTKVGNKFSNFATRNKKAATRAEAMQQQRMMRKKLNAAIHPGMNTSERIEARRRILAGQTAALAARAAAGDDGEAMEIDGVWHAVRADGTKMRIDPEDLFVDGETSTQWANKFQKVHGLRANQYVMGRSSVGPQLVPQTGDQRIVNCKTTEGTRYFAGDVKNFLPDHQKERPAGMSDTAYQWLLAQATVHAGGMTEDGRRVDFALANGIDLSTERGRAELDKALAGESSKFDDIHAEVPPETWRSIVAEAREMDRRDSTGMVGKYSEERSEAKARDQILIKERVDVMQEREVALEKASSDYTSAQAEVQRGLQARVSATQSLAKLVPQSTVDEHGAELPLHVQFETAQVKKQELETQFGATQQRRVTLETQIQSADTRISELRSTSSTLQSNLQAELDKAAKAANDAARAASEKAAANLQRQLESVQRDVQSEVQVKLAASTQLGSVQTEFVSLQSQVKDITAVTSQFEVAVNQEKKLGDLQITMADASAEMVKLTVKVEEDAKFLEMSHEVLRNDKGKNQLSVLVDAADDWEKEARTRHEALERAATEAREALKKAIENGDPAKITRATSELQRVVESSSDSVRRAAKEAAGKHKGNVQDAARMMADTAARALPEARQRAADKFDSRTAPFLWENAREKVKR